MANDPPEPVVVLMRFVDVVEDLFRQLAICGTQIRERQGVDRLR